MTLRENGLPSKKERVQKGSLIAAMFCVMRLRRIDKTKGLNEGEKRPAQ
jgi:hypothetical protein